MKSGGACADGRVVEHTRGALPALHRLVCEGPGWLHFEFVLECAMSAVKSCLHL